MSQLRWGERVIEDSDFIDGAVEGARGAVGVVADPGDGVEGFVVVTEKIGCAEKAVGVQDVNGGCAWCDDQRG